MEKHAGNQKYNTHIGRRRRGGYAPFWSVLALIVLIAYLAGQLFRANASTNAATYEVVTGNNNNATIYQALIIRDEQLYYSPMSGYMNYYTKNGVRIGVNSIVCTMDRDGSFFEKLKDELSSTVTSLDTSSLQQLQGVLTQVNQSFSLTDYSTIYSDKYALTSELMELLSSTIYENIAQNSLGETSFEAIRAEEAGIVLFSYDQMEHITPDAVTADLLNPSQYKNNKIAAGAYIEAGMPLYRMVNSEAFSVIFLLNDEDKLKYFLNSSLTLVFRQEDITLTGSFSHFIGADGQRYGVVSFDGYGYSFMNQRYVEIQINDNYVEGLKIPVSAVTEKDYFVVPKQFVTSGGNTSQNTPYCLVRTKEGDILREISIAAEQGEYYLVNISYFEEGEIILYVSSENSGQDMSLIYQISQTQPLQGVYQVNRGYTIFKPITVLYDTGDGYYIIDPAVSYTVREYDHIVLDASKYQEGDLIY